MFTHALLITLIIITISCSKKATLPTPHSSSATKSTDKPQSGSGGSSSTTTYEISAPETVDTAAWFNQLPDTYNESSDPNLKGKVFIIQRVQVYSPIYLDLDSEKTSLGNFSFPDLTFFKLPPKAPTVGKFSIYQPQPDAANYSGVTAANIENASSNTHFEILGHTINSALAQPNIPTGVVAPVITKKEYRQVYPPKDYKLIFESIGPDEDEIRDSCQKYFKDMSQKNFANLGGPSMTKLTACTTYMGRSTSTIQGNIGKGGQYTFIQTGDLSMQDYLNHKSLYVWEAVPQNNLYACLGTIVTDTSAKPQSLLSAQKHSRFSNASAGLMSASYKAFAAKAWGSYHAGSLSIPAMVCIKKTYLSKGKLTSQAIAYGTNQSTGATESARAIGFFQIAADPNDPNGLNHNLNFIRAITGTTKTDVDNKAKNLDIYVFNKKYVYMLEDFTLSPSSSSTTK